MFIIAYVYLISLSLASSLRAVSDNPHPTYLIFILSLIQHTFMIYQLYATPQELTHSGEGRDLSRTVPLCERYPTCWETPCPVCESTKRLEAVLLCICGVDTCLILLFHLKWLSIHSSFLIGSSFKKSPSPMGQEADSTLC